MDVILNVYDANSQCSPHQVSLPCIIGRSHDATVSIYSTLISRKHCEISIENGKLYLKDLDSLNGTYLHGVRIGSKVLLPWGDTFYFCDYSFQCEMLPEYKNEMEGNHIDEGNVNELTQDENVKMPLLLRPTKVELDGDSGSTPIIPKEALDTFANNGSGTIPQVDNGTDGNNMDLEKNPELEDSSGSGQSQVFVKLDPLTGAEGFIDGDSQANDFFSSSSSQVINLIDEANRSYPEDPSMPKKINTSFGQSLE